MTEIDIKKACKAGDSSPSVKRKVLHAMYSVVAFMPLCILDIVIVLRVGWGEILLIIPRLQNSRFRTLSEIRKHVSSRPFVQMWSVAHTGKKIQLFYSLHVNHFLLGKLEINAGLMGPLAHMWTLPRVMLLIRKQLVTKCTLKVVYTSAIL